MTSEEKIVCDDGKYTFYLNSSGVMYCDRHGQRWREFLGDGAVLALFQHARELEEKLAKQRE